LTARRSGVHAIVVFLCGILGAGTGAQAETQTATQAETYHLFDPGAGTGAQRETFHLFRPQDLQDPDVATDTGSTTGKGPPLGRLLGEDLRLVVTSPARLHWRGWTATALTLGALGAIIHNEKGDVDPAEGPEGSRTARGVAGLFEPLGAEGALAVLGGFYLVGKARNDPRAKAVAVDGVIASLLAGGLLSGLLKGVSGRSRPHQSSSAIDFHPFSGHSGFPSGHTTEAFAVASVIATEYKSPWVGALAYGSAGLVGYARVLHDRHQVSDALAGALLGTLVGRTVARHNKRLRESRFTISPRVTDHAGAGLMFTLHLNRRKARRRRARRPEGAQDGPQK
jgi:membrane-associated phospholipid phosphatase